jgi:apolipoprotein D and lipocalin family protein
MGTWFEIARLPEPFQAACSGQPSAHYSMRDGLVRVVNRCPARDGGERISRGIARVVRGSDNAKLKLTFAPRLLRFLPPVWGDYWVLHVDAAYQVAVVGHPNRHYLWFLSRSPQLAPERLAALRQFAADRGFAVERMVSAQPGAHPESV